jgi:hypothetical protein
MKPTYCKKTERNSNMGKRLLPGRRLAGALFALFTISPKLFAQAGGETLPVYFVTQSGVTSNQAGMLENFLAVPTNMVTFSNGEVSFVDPTNYMAVPMIPLTDSNTINMLVDQTPNKVPGIPIICQQIDFAGVSNISAIGSNAAVGMANAAMGGAGLMPALPESATALVTHTVLTASYTNELGVVNSVSNGIDTDVSYQFSLTGGVPLIGPGAQAQFTWGAIGGATRVEYAARLLAPGPSVQLIPLSVASNEAAALYPGLNPQITAQLVYYAPPLSLATVQTVIPWYIFTGTGTQTNPGWQTGAPVELIPSMIPATADTNYVPTVTLTANPGSAPTQVVASVVVTGGTPPYTYEWSASPGVITNTGSRLIYSPTVRVTPPLMSVAVLPGSAGSPGFPPTGPSLNLTWSDPLQVFSVESSSNIGSGVVWVTVTNDLVTTNQTSTVYIPLSSNTPNYYRMTWTRATLPVTETVGVTVIDANGVAIRAGAKLGVLATPIVVPNIVPPPQQIGWGFESPYDPGLGTTDEQDWFFAMGGNSVFGTIELGYVSYAAESVDFLDAPAGDNDYTVDQTDITLYIGHGNPDGFTFTSPYSSDGLGFNQPYHTWGNRKDEWLCLLSCSVLDFWDSSNLNVAQRWGPAMDGLHVLMGFSTDALAETGFPTAFAQNMGGKWWTHIANAWCAAAKSRGTGTPAVLAPIGPGAVTDLGDDWWGLGPVGPRIRASQIEGFAYETSLPY